jgi:hypothetical protein
MADVRDRANRSDRDAKEHDVRILDDTVASEPVSFRHGDTFDLYHDGKSVKFVVTEIVERDGRRVTYGVPAHVRTS